MDDNDLVALAFFGTILAVVLVLVLPVALVLVYRQRKTHPDRPISKETVPGLYLAWIVAAGWLIFVVVTLANFKMTRLM